VLVEKAQPQGQTQVRDLMSRLVEWCPKVDLPGPKQPSVEKLHRLREPKGLSLH
jgi:hypothetical protein